eukprot:m.83820 g.83820  ORF g.83820 m.83820 type:complete len:451 (-) comp25675_c0_seq2:185-1537(-)
MMGSRSQLTSHGFAFLFYSMVWIFPIHMLQHKVDAAAVSISSIPTDVPPQFTAPFQYEPGLVGTFYQDATNTRYAMNFLDRQLPGHLSKVNTNGLTQNWTMVATTKHTNVIDNGVCRVVNEQFQDFFGWVSNPNAVFIGQTTFDHRACNHWGLPEPNQPGKNAIEVCLDLQTNVPVVLVIGTHTEWIFGEPVQIGPPKQSAFDVRSVCDSVPPACPNGVVESLEAVVFHPRGMYNIAGQDVGDLLGDTFFLCAAGPSATSAGQQYSVVSKWELEVWTGYGQYALCNGYPPTCIGNETFLVGREAATGFKDLGGQCTNNSNDIGSWFSLSAAGQCETNQQPDGKTCSWKAVRKVKSVNVTCPSFDGFFRTCDSETTLPLTASATKLAQIFNSDLPTVGGCPALANNDVAGAVIGDDAEITATSKSTSHLEKLGASSVESTLRFLRRVTQRT